MKHTLEVIAVALFATGSLVAALIVGFLYVLRILFGDEIREDEWP